MAVAFTSGGKHRGIGCTLVISPVLVAFLGVLALIATLNFTAKRFRDMGAPDWGATAGVTALNTVLIVAAPGVTYPWFSIAVFAALALTPTDALVNRD